MNEFIRAMTKDFANFKGRARRREFWIFMLIITIINRILIYVEISLGIHDFSINIGLLTGMFALIILIPSLAVTARRMHDIGRSGWWALTAIIPFWLWFIAVFDGEPDANKWGSNPKQHIPATLNH